MRLSEVIGLVREPSFRLLWMSRTVSAMGSAIVMVAMALAVLEIGGSVAELGLVLAFGALTEVAMLLIGGVWADRLPRRTVMLSVDLIRCMMAATIAVLLFSGNAQLWHFGLVAIVDAVGKAFFRPASSGLIAETVQPQKLLQANALLSLSAQGSAVIGPALAGIIVTFSNAGFAYAVDAASFAASALMLVRLHVPKREPRARAGFWRDLSEGWQEVVWRPWLWQNLITHGLWNFGFSMIFVFGPVIMIQRSGGAAAWAAVSTGIAVGSVLGSLVALQLRIRYPLVVGNLALILGAGPFLVLALKLPIWALVGSAVIATVGLAVLSALWNSTLQQLIPTHSLSRVTSYDWVVSLSITPLAFATAGLLSNAIGITNTVLVCAAMIAVPSALITFAPQIRAVRRDADGTITGPGVVNTSKAKEPMAQVTSP